MASSFESLPDAVILLVLSFLPRNDLLSASSVDTLFLRLSRDELSWQTSWQLRAGILRWRRVGAPLRTFRVYTDPALSGGLPLWQLSALQPLNMPSSLVREPLRKLSLRRAGDAGAGGAIRAVRFEGALGSNRAIVADCPFPRVEWRRSSAGDAFLLPLRSGSVLCGLPFAWAPPVSAAQRHGSGCGGVISSAANREDADEATGSAGSTIFLAGAYVAAYFEVHFTADGKGGIGSRAGGEREGPPREPSPSTVSVGLVGSGFPLLRMPGWDAQSYGYHGDDGQRFHDSPFGVPFGPLFGPDDVVGCGLIYADLGAPGVKPARDFSAWSDLSALDAAAALPAPIRRDGDPISPGTIFFTLNGRMVGPAFHGVDTTSAWFPCVGIDARLTARFSFGNVPSEPFVFNIRDFNLGLLARLPPTVVPPLPPVATRFFVRNTRSQVLPYLRTTLAPPPPYSAARTSSGGQPSPPRDDRSGPPTAPSAFSTAPNIFSDALESHDTFATPHLRAAMRGRQHLQLLLHRIAVVLAIEKVHVTPLLSSRDSEDEEGGAAGAHASHNTGKTAAGGGPGAHDVSHEHATWSFDAELRSGWRLRSGDESEASDAEDAGGSTAGSGSDAAASSETLASALSAATSLRRQLALDWLGSKRTDASFPDFLRRAVEEIVEEDISAAMPL
jgi:hypothetical protein